uniref:RING-type domain-containing protein n=1 Tax=Pyramimonas orientalis virus TaxID=455367 RepID=A0A7M3UP93_POV01|nr:hypothetical protein HWQ62_00435 [Pyramimonas orientalis virus]
MTCPICLDNINASDMFVTTSCNHTFHTQCITICAKRDHTQCPMCRCDISNDLIQWKMIPTPCFQPEESDDDSDDEPDLPQIKRGFFHRMVFGNKRHL